jgi:soluble lytic murein transglycosylase-like protein
MTWSRTRIAALSGLLLFAAPCARLPQPGPAAVAAAEPAADDAHVELVHTRLRQRTRGLSDAELRRLARTVVEASRREDLPPALVLAVIEVESDYDPFAVSPVGAMGLMQLLPETGAEVAGRLGIRWKGAPTLFDPDVNVRLGTAYLRSLVDRYDNWHAALAAYNWGPGRVDARLRDGAAVPADYAREVLSTYSVRRTDRADS